MNPTVRNAVMKSIFPQSKVTKKKQNNAFKYIKGFIEPVNNKSNDKMYRDRNFYITEFKLVETSEGWLRLDIEWNSDSFKEENKKIKFISFKYVSEEGTSSSSNGEERIFFRFSELNIKNKYGCLNTHFDAGIYVDNETIDENIWFSNYKYKYFENLKYGVSLYFSPKEFGTGAEKILQYIDNSKGKESFV